MALPGRDHPKKWKLCSARDYCNQTGRCANGTARDRMYIRYEVMLMLRQNQCVAGSFFMTDGISDHWYIIKVFIISILHTINFKSIFIL